jgi:SAM-dependent methyltransferase
MTYFDPARPPEERIQQAIVHGPDMSAGGRFGAITRLARRMVGRAVKYERDFNLQIDVALLDKLHEIEDTAAERLQEVDERLRGADEELRDAHKDLRDIDARAERETLVLQDRIKALEEVVKELNRRIEDANTSAAVANTIAAGAAGGFESLLVESSRIDDRVSQLDDAVRTGNEKAEFAYNEMTALPYLADEAMLRFTDTRGRERLGYHGAVGASPLYTGFEEIFRGPEAMVRDRQRVYVDLLVEHSPVVDLGCGRGEMLELLLAAGVEVTGVDLDEGMVERARRTGAEVHHGDALNFLMKQEDASLGAIFSAQFIEHVPVNQLPELLEIARSKLRPGGVFVAETVNPHSPRALKVFWIDPTHQHPLFPETMLALCRLTGFESAEIMFPLGTNDLLADLHSCGEYAVVAGARELT